MGNTSYVKSGLGIKFWTDQDRIYSTIFSTNFYKVQMYWTEWIKFLPDDASYGT